MSVRRTIGVILLVIALILTGVVGYQVWGTGWMSNRAQEDASQSLQDAWDNGDDTAAVDLDDQGNGQNPNTIGDNAVPELSANAFAVMQIPRYGSDWQYTVLDSVSQPALATGPGWYPETAQPGEVGNSAYAGHRMGYGAPFDRLAELEACDEIIITTRTHQYTYNVLPANPDAASRYKRSSCFDEQQREEIYEGDYSGIPGYRITTPNDVGVLDDVPYGTVDDPEYGLLTLTTCHPWYSNEQRQIIHAMLTDTRVL